MATQIFLVDDAGRWTQPRDPLTGHRSESWRVDLLNNQDAVVSQLIGVSGGSFEFNVNATIRGGGSLAYSGPPIDWNQHRVQPWYRIEAGDEVVEWPLGVFLVATPDSKHTDADVSVDLALYDKTLILDQDKTPTSFSVAKGANVIASVRSVLAAAGQTRTAIEDSTQTLSKAMVWPVGTSRLRIINDLLDAANYFSIWVDGEGIFRAEPYRAPANRGQSYAFRDDSKGIYSPTFSHEFDTFEVPNRVIVIGQSEGDTEAPSVVVEDTGSGPFSYPSRGRWITRVEEGVEATDTSTLQGIARRFLAEGQQVGSTYSINHAPIPLELNSVVGFERAARGIQVNATVQTITYSMETGALCQTTLREYQT